MARPSRFGVPTGVAVLLIVAAVVGGRVVSGVSTAGGPIPDVATIVDGGCVDVAGVLQGNAAQWYRPGSKGMVRLQGAAAVAVGADDWYQAAARSAVEAVVAGFEPNGAVEFTAADGCTTHRFASLAHDNEEIDVNLWRATSAADLVGVQNEVPFVRRDTTTLVSSGPHIVAVLFVAPDGTTIEVAAFGAYARQLGMGYTSSAVPTIDHQPGPAGLSIEQVASIAAPILATVMAHRGA